MLPESAGNVSKQIVDGQPLILYVEDNEDNRLLCVYILQGLGYSYITAYDGNTALELLQHYQPDLILLDIDLPGMDGLEVMNCLKQNSQTVAIPVIAVTAKVMDSEREKIRAAGCNDYISKPYDIKALEALINCYFNR